MSRPRARPGRDFRGTESLACDSLRLIPPLGQAACRGKMLTREDSKERRKGLGCSSVVCFCTEIRSAFCIVPVQASGIFGQVRLACACPSFACLLCCLRSCAHALIHRSCALVSLSTLELSLSRLLARPLASLYLPLPHLLFFLQSTSLCTFTFKHASFYCFGIVGQEASRTLTSFLLFSPSHLPLGYYRYAA